MFVIEPLARFVNTCTVLTALDIENTVGGK